MPEVSDSFNRADSVSNLGNADTGQTWQQNRGTWGISSGHAYTPSTGAGGFVGAQATVPLSSSSQDVTVTYDAQDTQNSSGVGLLLRYIDNNNYCFAMLFRTGGGSWPQLFAGKVVAGVLTYSLATAMSIAGQSPPFQLHVTISDTDVWNIYVGGVLYVSAAETANATGTRVGLLSNDNVQAIVDSFQADPVVVPVGIVTGGSDYPDWTQRNQFTAVPFVDDSGSLATDLTYGPFFAGNFDALEVLSSFATAVGWQITLAWYADQALGLLLDAFTFQRPSGVGAIASTIAQRGPWFTVTIKANDYSSARPYSLVVFPRDVHLPSAAPVGSGNLINDIGSTINAGATRSLNAFTSTLARAVWSVGTDSPSWHAELQGRDWNGAILYQLGGMSSHGSGGTTVEVTLNGTRAAMFVTNIDATPHIFHSSLQVAV